MFQIKFADVTGVLLVFFFFKQKTAYEMRISDWSSDVCSSDLDNGEGTPDKACPEGQKRTDCFHDLAKFKRVYKIEMSDANAGQPVRKIGYIDQIGRASCRERVCQYV